MDEKIILYYIGRGGSFVPGAPARDLTQADIDASGFLCDELLAYREVYARSPAPRAEPITTINPNDGINDTEARAAGSALRKRRDEATERPPGKGA